MVGTPTVDTCRHVPQPAETREPRFLVMIEHAYRGLIERQYADIVWMAECIQRMGAHVDLVLKGYAVLHATNVPDHSGILDLANTRLEKVGDLRGSIRATQAAGATVMVFEEDWRRLSPGPLMEGVRMAKRAELSHLIGQAHQAWYF